MSYDRFLEVVNGLTIPAEGGDKFTDFHNDPGGATKYGITLNTMNTAHFWLDSNGTFTADDVRNLTLEDAQTIYYDLYWIVVAGNDLPLGIDSMVFDFGVTSGTSRAGKQLQTLIGFTGTDVDGWIGPETLARVKMMPVPTLLSALRAEQLSFVDDIQNSAASADRKGWENRVNRRYDFSQPKATPTA